MQQSDPYRPWRAPGGCALALGALTLAVLAVHRRPLGPDGFLHHWTLEHRTAALTEVATAVTDSAQVVAYALAAVAGLFGGVQLSRRPGRSLVMPVAGAAGVVIAVAWLALGQYVRNGFVDAVARARPAVADRAVAVGGYAFPSGHTTTSALGAGIACVVLTWPAPRETPGTRMTPVTRLRRSVAGVALGWAAAVGATRVYLGVHWPSDVLAGWLLAATIVLAVRSLGRRALATHRSPIQADVGDWPVRARRAGPRCQRASRSSGRIFSW